MFNQKRFAIGIMGPTASGKSELAELLAGRLDSKIVNADAFQVYRGLDIGTNKPAHRCRYELLDILDPWEPFTVGKFIECASSIVRREAASGRHVVICGGTGLYLRGLFEGYSEIAPPPSQETRQRLQAEYQEMGPETFARKYGVDPDSVPRQTLLNPRHFVRAVERSLSGVPAVEVEPLPVRPLKIGLVLPKPALDERIEKRTRDMMQNGWLEEVAALRGRGASQDWPGMKAIGYRQLLQVLDGTLPLADALGSIQAQTRQYAKRQMTWLRKEPGVRLLDAAKAASNLIEEIELMMQLHEGGSDGKGH